MHIELRKFGNILTSREAGREAYSAFLPTLNSLAENEEITIDFQQISVLTPSWADEFIRPIIQKHTKKVSFIHDSNPSVQTALRFVNPKLNLSKITVFQDALVFEEITHEKIYMGKAAWVPTFPFSDEEALRILKNNKVKKISINPVDRLSDTRLKAVIQMLNQAGIKTMINK